MPSGATQLYRGFASQGKLFVRQPSPCKRFGTASFSLNSLAQRSFTFAPCHQGQGDVLVPAGMEQGHEIPQWDSSLPSLPVCLLVMQEFLPL